MLKEQDIVVLCKLSGRSDGWTLADIGTELGLAPSAVHRSLARAGDGRLYDRTSRMVAVTALHGLLVHGGRHLFPERRTGETRGVPTAWSAPPLDDERGALPVVWPHPHGSSRGLGLEPIHPIVPAAALQDPLLHARLALLDAIRIGDARIRREAGDLLADALGAAADRA
ncbi:MAG: hypothetical protein AB7V62_02470 [Thermoleophilia bacterium]